MDTKKLRKQYMPLVPKINNALKYVESQLSDLPPSEFSVETNVKPYPSVKRKVEAENIHDPLELSDLVRGRLFFSDQFKFDDVIDIIKQLFGNKVKGVDKKTDRSKEHGLEYHGVIHVDMDIDGIRFELQLMPHEFKPYKDFLHEIYEKFRNPKVHDKMTDKQKEILRNTHNRMYKKLDEKAQSNRTDN